MRPVPPDPAGALTPSTHNPKGSRCRFVASPCSPLAVSPPVCPPPVGDLIERYTQVAPEVEIIAYQYGYHGLLTGNYIVIDDEARKNAGILRDFGGSPIGNSRVKLTNAKNLVERGLVAEGVNPLEFAPSSCAGRRRRPAHHRRGRHQHHRRRPGRLPA